MHLGSERLLFRSASEPEALVRRMHDVFLKQRGVFAMPNITGVSVGPASFRIRTKWSVAFVSSAIAGMVVSMTAEVKGHDQGSVISIAFHTDRGRLLLLNLLLVLYLLWFFFGPHAGASSNLQPQLKRFAPLIIMTYLPVAAVLGTSRVRWLLKEEFVKCFELREIGGDHG